MTGYIERDLAKSVAAALADMPVVVVTGPRQSGKSTFLQRDPIFRGRRYVTLDDLGSLAAARTDPEGFTDTDEPITIDEVQRCPELLIAVKRSVDRDRRPGRFVLSGSANLALLKNVSESLAGRAVYFPLMPFNRRETEGQTSDEPRLFAMFESGEVARQRREGLGIDDEVVLEGGFPEVALGKVRDRRLWFRGYESTYIERDLRDLTQIADLVTFRTLMRLAALRTGGLLNVSEIAREAKMPVSTAARYLGALEVSCLIERVPPFLNSKASRLIKMPKVYVADSGLAANLCGIDDISPSAGERMRGALYETYFHQNLRAMTAAHRPDIEIGYWNVQGRHEVDFVLSTPRRALAIEVKSGPRVAPEDAQGLKALMNSSAAVKLGLIAYLGKETTKLADSIWAIPMGSLLA